MEMAGQPATSEIAAQPEIKGASGKVWSLGEARHEGEVVMKPPPMMSKQEQAAFKSRYTKEQKREWGYPDYPAEFDDPQWYKEQFARERNDPRENANFFLDPKHPEFWDNAARKPYSKAILKTDEHWKYRRETWKMQKMNVEELNRHRQEYAEHLEDCPMELKRLVTPVLKYTVVETFLSNLNMEALEKDMPFQQVLEQPEHMERMKYLRNAIDMGGDKAAEWILEEYTSRNADYLKDEDKKRKLKLKERGKIEDPSLKKLTEALNAGAKYKKDGVLEWEKGNHKEALESWRRANEQLQQWKAPASCVAENKQADELHVNVLKNLAQAAIKLCYWNEALDAASDALSMDDQDHKAWFRKACALEGLGRLQEVEECLAQIEDIAVGRPDRERIQKDMQVKRDKIKSIQDKEEAMNKLMLERGVKKEIFSEDRSQDMLLHPPPMDAPPILDKARWIFTQHDGYIAGGKTLHSEVMSIEDAKLKCKHLPGCQGFMLKGAPREGKLKITFKDKWGLHGTGWTSYRYELYDPEVVDDVKRKRITKDGAVDLLDVLAEAYSETGFKQKVEKLAYDMRYYPDEDFRAHLARVAYEVQRPILEKWGFEVSQRGVQEMTKALSDHTRGTNSDPKLKQRAESVYRMLYGDRYEAAMANALPEDVRLLPVERPQKLQDESDSDS